MMEAYLRERFPSADADDIIQETFIALCEIIPSYRYSPDEKGYFHNYLTGILRNKALRQIRNERGQANLATAATADATKQENDAPAIALENADGQAMREAIFELALRSFLADETIAERTKRIFERVAINGESPEAVAAAFKINRHAVDQAKARALERLRKIVKQFESAANG